MTYLNALTLHPNNPIEQKKYLQLSFKKTMTKLKYFIKCNELDIRKESMTYVFEHIKPTIIKLISHFVKTEDKVLIESNKWDDYNFRKKLFECLVELGDKSIMIWVFFHFNYYYLSNLDLQRKILLENIEIFSKYFPKSLYFTDINDLYNTCSKCNPLFSISYQNKNNREILENYSLLLRKICPDLNYIAPHCNNSNSNNTNNKQNVNGNGKIKVAFFSEFLTMDSSVLRDRLGIISQLPKNKFDVYYMSFMKPESITGYICKTFYNMNKSSYIQVPENIKDARNFIANQKFDIIVYCELGMLLRPLYLSYSRLAKVQITTWGHSETSGINTIDYFVSSKYFEIEESKVQNQYSEKIHLMNSLSTYYYPPTKILLPPNQTFKPRKDFGLDDTMNVYGCIQSSFKISVEFEKMLNGILKGDPKARILMSLNKPFCRSQVARIFNLLGENDFKRLLFYPSLDITSYMNLIKLSDVILDPYPFGGCNTSFEAFDYNIPVVSMPTKYLNGRFTFGMYKKMGFVDMIADTSQNYIDIAVKTGTDKKFKESIKEKINNSKHLLFQEKEAIQEWSSFLESTIS